MAFATTNVRSGTAGPFKMVAGDWSGSVGDSSGTVTVGGSRVYQAHFYNQDADNPKEWPQVDVSESSPTSTITVHNHQGVTNGRFYILFA